MKILVLFFFLFLGLTACAPKDKTPSHQHEIEKAVWTCPMHPQIKKDAPGNCPICGMNLVKIENETNKVEGETHSDFQLSPYRKQLIGVKTLLVEKKNLIHSITAPGKVAFDPELYAAQSEYFIALKQYAELSKSPLVDVKKSAAQMRDSAKMRLKVLGLSDDQIRKLENRGDDGGGLLLPQKGETLLIYAEVFEMDLRSIVPGLKVKISGENIGGKVLEGKVASVDRIINPNTRTAKVRIEVPKAEALLRSESYVDVEILTPMGKEIAIPFDAILDTGKEAWVFVDKGEGKFEARKVQIKFHADSEVAIGEGLSEGEKIVSSANFLIDSESRLKSVINKAE